MLMFHLGITLTSCLCYEWSVNSDVVCKGPYFLQFHLFHIELLSRLGRYHWIKTNCLERKWYVIWVSWKVVIWAGSYTNGLKCVYLFDVATQAFLDHDQEGHTSSSKTWTLPPYFSNKWLRLYPSISMLASNWQEINCLQYMQLVQ